MSKNYCKKSPCPNCPYRKDAPLQLWSWEEFSDLLDAEESELGKVYGCHKNDGSACTGFVMDQDKRGVPSIMLRLALSRNGVTREFLDSLKSKHPLYDSILEMARANYPDIF